jgi:ubiquinone/menaquinone biosynthesis C-methylase UbiE
MNKNYKETEEQHYDLNVMHRKENAFSSNDYVLRKSKDCYYSLINKEINQQQSINVLDYGSGSGDKHFHLSSENVKIIGVDISSKSIEYANNYVIENGINAEYVVMDCEKMSFPDNNFDIVFDFGTFSSLNMQVAIKELCRVIKPTGMLICIETYGHNPFMKIKRWFNVLQGKRTKWAASHIMKKNDWTKICNYFNNYEIQYYHFSVLFLPIFMKILPKALGNIVLSIAENVDTKLLKIELLRKLAFKTVVVLKNPNK